MDRCKPTVQLLGRWQPWHRGHTELFKKAIQQTGQVIIQVRDMSISNDNPYDYASVKLKIVNALEQDGYKYGIDYEIMQVPNIIDISYGRDVGYSITQHDLGEEIHSISGTKIRKKLK